MTKILECCYRFRQHDSGSISLTKSPKGKLPKSIDWRRKGAVSKVKNQGDKCNGCWAMVAAGALEGQHFRKTGRLVSLSEQNLIDCSSSYGNKGCQYGWVFKAFEYIKHNGGIQSDKTYPYTAKQNKCKYNKRYSVATDRGYVALPYNDEEKLMQAIALVGPIAVQINAGCASFQHYAGGVYNDPKCNPKKTNHAVLVVGYGTDKKGYDFYIVKNTWGPLWGEKGYVRMIRNRNSCGIASFGFYPLV